MADETTDAANKEQLVIVYCWVDDEFVAHKEFVGLQDLKKADTQSSFHKLNKSMMTNTMMGEVQCLELRVVLLSSS